MLTGLELYNYNRLFTIQWGEVYSKTIVHIKTLVNDWIQTIWHYMMAKNGRLGWNWQLTDYNILMESTVLFSWESSIKLSSRVVYCIVVVAVLWEHINLLCNWNIIKRSVIGLRILFKVLGKEISSGKSLINWSGRFRMWRFVPVEVTIKSTSELKPFKSYSTYQVKQSS